MLALTSRSLGIALALVALAGCDRAPPPEPAPVGRTEPPPPLTSRPVPTGPSCNVAAVERCDEYPADRIWMPAGTDLRVNCGIAGGTWSEAPCPREGSIGECARQDGVVVVYGPARALDAASFCDPVRDRYFPAPGAEPLPSLAAGPAEPVAPTPDPAAAPAAAPEAAPVAAPREPRYRIEAPPHFVPWEPPWHPGVRDLEAHRSERGYGPTDAHVILIVRVQEVLPEGTLADTIAPHIALMEANDVHVVSHRATSSAGAPGLRWDETARSEDGEPTRTITLQVLDGTLLYTVTCGSAAATFSTWRPICDRALGSFRVLPD